MAFITLDSHAFAHNISQIARFAPRERLSIVLKDNAYGHGLAEMASLASKEGIAHAVVRTVDEARMIAGAFETVLVLADIPESFAGEKIHITLNDLSQIARIPQGTPVHLKVDTGMHRNGVAGSDVRMAMEKIREAGLILAGLFTHSRSGDELSTELFWQLQNFKAVREEVIGICEASGAPLPLFHFANSPTLLRFGEEVVFDRVRVGIAAYGYTEFGPAFDVPPLRPVLRLWGERMATRKVTAGMRIGYGGSGIVEKDGYVSTYDLGYADGLFRYNGSGDFELDGGERLYGKISMDNLVASGDAAELLVVGDANRWAGHFGTINYDVLVKLSPRIKRKII